MNKVIGALSVLLALSVLWVLQELWAVVAQRDSRGTTVPPARVVIRDNRGPGATVEVRENLASRAYLELQGYPEHLGALVRKVR